jgi:hypothetical protein
MGVLTPKRAVLFVVAAVLGTTAFASNPSPRTLARLVWDTPNNVGILFGGIGPFDGATSLQHDSAETWLWNGSRWLQRFPATSPSARAVHAMVYDTKRNRPVLFGGRQSPSEAGGDPTFLNDTWVYENDTWRPIDSVEKPPVRQTGAMTYDRVRDKVVLYGGNILSEDGTTFVARYDTWEFDGAQWQEIIHEGPKVAKPIITYDATRNETIMVGLNDTGTTRVMYRYVPADKTWTAVTPEKLPTCVNDGHLVFQEHTGRLLFLGGICPTDTPTLEEAWEWDGTNWSKLTIGGFARGSGQAVAYDPLRHEVVMFGGTAALGSVLASSTNIIEDGVWVIPPIISYRPQPRSQAGFQTDVATNTIWMFGGLDETSTFYHTDIWGYRNGQWFANNQGPSACDGPLSAFDSDRGRLVVTCGGTDTWEWDGTVWKPFPDLKKEPSSRRFASLVYDPKLKKTVLFGGYNNNTFYNDTWTWNGTEWTEVKVDKKAKPPNRGQMAMWYDPLQQKVILYGGIGRGSLNDNVTRYEDMWSFSGTAWTKLTVSETPGSRFGPQVAANQVSGKVLLFGGLRAEPLDGDTTGKKLRQVFMNDTWEWDGTASKWTRLTTDPATPEPDVRENGSMAWDPTASRVVLFAGYADGFYRSDIWEWNGQDWVPRLEQAARRRASGH